MKNLITIVLVLLSFASGAQVKTVNIQASGLTCSMCSNSIFKGLMKLDFVDKVDTDIKNSSFNISFKHGANVDFDKLKAKVEDAGFFVARFTVVMNFDKLAIANDTHISVGNSNFHFLNVTARELSGDKTVRLLDKGFVSAKEYKKNSSYTKLECYKTGLSGTCCAKDNLPTGKRIFHVTI